MKKIILFLVIAAFGALGVGILSNDVIVSPQEIGQYRGTDDLNNFECSCEDPENPGTFGPQFCPSSPICP